MKPSVGNWQKPCRSHYLIIRGDVIWAEQWTTDEIVAGRDMEAARRNEYFDGKYANVGALQRFKQFLRKLLQ